MREVAKKKVVEQGAAVEAMQMAFDPALLRGALLDVVVRAGLVVVEGMLEKERDEKCGPRYRHDEQRRAGRGGYADAELPLAGRRVRVKRPRVMAKDPAGRRREVRLETWDRLAQRDPLDRRAVDQVLVGVATRKYERSLEKLPADVSARGASKSAVSRRFVAATSTAFATLMTTDLADLDLVALMIDGLVVGEYTVLVALGFDAKGDKHILGLREGATENGVACKALLANLEKRGLRTDRSTLVVLDGSQALISAVRAVFGARALMQRCRVHKARNVRDQLPEDLRHVVARRVRLAYQSNTADGAERALTRIAAELEKDHPSAAASLREGLAETLTVMRLKLSAALTRTLSSTNAIENINGLVRQRTKNVRRWRDGTMVQRWTATALGDAAKSFRRIRGHKDVPLLVAALRAHDEKLARDEVRTQDAMSVDTARKTA
jgi:transposase-like protein